MWIRLTQCKLLNMTIVLIFLMLMTSCGVLSAAARKVKNNILQHTQGQHIITATPIPISPNGNAVTSESPSLSILENWMKSQSH